MPRGYMGQVLGGSAQGDGTAVSGTTAATLLPGQARPTIPAQLMEFPGAKFWVRAHGRMSNIVTTPGTLTLDIRLGAVIASTSVAFALNVNAKTNVAWWLDLMLQLRTIGNGVVATILGQGVFESESVVGSPLPSVGGIGALPWQSSAPAAGTGFDSTVAQQVDMFAKFSLTGNSITLHDFEFMSAN